MTITLFCASSKKVDEKYFKAARTLADHLLESAVAVRYGGGAIGLMGAIADRYLERNGNITGIIPEFMVKVEWAHPGLKDLIVVNDMHQRKKLLIENSDAVVALPGGSGTLEELMEVFSLKRLGKYLKPIVLLNTDGFYNGLLEFTDKMIKERFLREEHRNIWTIVDNPNDVLPAIKNSPQWDENAINTASV